MRTLGLAEMEMEVNSSFDKHSNFGFTEARSAFQWGGSIFVLGQFGCWVAFLVVVSNLFFPQTFPVSCFILFVITPDWLADRLRDDIVPGILCLIIAILLVLTEIRGIGGLENCPCNCHCFGYWFGIACLFFFTVLYLAT